MDLLDFEISAKSILPIEVFDFLSGGSADELTLSHNTKVFKSLGLVPRILRDVSSCSGAIQILQSSFSLPILGAPMAYHNWFHEEGELGVLRACSKKQIPLIVSMFSSTSVEVLNQESKANFWFQLYMLRNREFMKKLIERVNQTKCKAFVLTVDMPVMAERSRDRKNSLRMPENINPVHLDGLNHEDVGYSIKEFTDLYIDPSLTWDVIAWIKKYTKLPVLVKGLLHELDVEMALDAGVDGIIVSNHGGRQLESIFASIELLSAIADLVRGRVPVLFDGGIRSGRDIFKAIGLGANAVLLGRPLLWGLSINGQSGAEEVLDLLDEQFIETMKFCGCRTVEEIRTEGPSIVRWLDKNFSK